MSEVTLEQANRLIRTALEKGREMGLPPLCVAVLDPGGHLKALAREDGQTFLRAQVSQAKAWGALALGIHSRHIASRYEQGARQAGFITAMNSLTGGNLVPLPGGLLIRDAQGQLIGAIGVSGAVSEDDELCAVAAIQALGFTVDLD